MSDASPSSTDGPDRADRDAGRDLRAARRPSSSPASSARRTSSSAAGAASPCARRGSRCAEARRAPASRRRCRRRLRRRVHALHRRDDGGRAARGRAAEPDRRAGARSAAHAVRLAWRERGRVRAHQRGGTNYELRRTMSEGHCGSRLGVCSRSAAQQFPAAGVPKSIARRDAEHDRLGGLHPAPVGEAVREADRLQGARQVRRLLRRDGRR